MKLSYIEQIKYVFLLFTVIFTQSLSATQPNENRVSIIDEDSVALELRFDAIATAKEEILISYFHIDDDDTTREILSLLERKASEGVKVKIIVDGLFNGISLSYRNILIAAGVEIKLFNKRNLFRLGRMVKYRLHDKLFIVDGKHLIIGGRNMAQEYFGKGKKPYKDRDIYVRGPSAMDAKKYYDSLWVAPHLTSVKYKSHDKKCRIYKGSRHRSSVDRYQKCIEEMDLNNFHAEREIDSYQYYYYKRHEELLKNNRDLILEGLMLSNIDQLEAISKAEIIHDKVTPRKEKLGVTAQKLYDSIRLAERKVLIETPYLILTKELESLLLELSQKGVEIKIITNSLKTTDGILPQAAYLNDARDILKIGVEIYEFFGDASLHSKSVVVDDKIAIIGTYNFDPRSQNLNTETFIALYDKGAAGILQKRIYENIALSLKLKKDGRPIGHSGRLPETSFTKRVITRIFQGLIVPISRGLL